MEKKALDFIVIGAQKAGTTALYKYLAAHPGIYLPLVKETNFFSDDENYRKGGEFLFSEHYRNAAPSKKWGDVSPSYMAGGFAAPVEEIARRIFVHAPGVKLIAALRHPVERAYSHYKMSVRRGWEKRSFAEAVREQMSRRGEALERPTETNSYLAWGEYGRILEIYGEKFDRDTLFVTTAEALASDPGRIVKQIFAFIGVDPEFTPPNLGKRYHVGGKERRLSWLPNDVDKISFLPWKIRLAYRKLPLSWRMSARFWLEIWNTKPSRQDSGGLPALDPALREDLVRYFSADVGRLGELGIETGWEEWQASRAPLT
ncbi:MAG TPA: sulfotransferase [Verrucomicrobiae bacterium]|jgi:hypothetical protein|nr:sulfotransferase [Verrucomicrobiae bacterium]